MGSRDDLHIRDPNGFEGREGKVVLTSGGAIVHNAAVDAGFCWDYSELTWVVPADCQFHFIGIYNNEQVFSVEVGELEVRQLQARVSGLRSFLGSLPEGLFRLLGRALQINEWHRAHSFCGFCGERTRIVDNERAMGCGSCGRIFYPRLSPCIMALITRGDECLLARNGQWNLPYFSVLAGFIEPGESAEDALRREVMEEVGLEVGGLHYKGSQPWPFPGQLMLGFFADYASGDIRVDGIEIADARWYHYSDLPQVPGEFSLSGQLIRRFVSERSCRGTGGER